MAGFRAQPLSPGLAVYLSLIWFPLRCLQKYQDGDSRSDPTSSQVSASEQKDFHIPCFSEMSHSPNMFHGNPWALGRKQSYAHPWSDRCGQGSVSSDLLRPESLLSPESQGGAVLIRTTCTESGEGQSRRCDHRNAELTTNVRFSSSATDLRCCVSFWPGTWNQAIQHHRVPGD